MATGTAGTNDVETRGMVGGDCLMSSVETEAEQKQARFLAGLRKGGYDDGMTVASYSSSLPVGVRPPRDASSEYDSDASRRLKQPLLAAVDDYSSDSLSSGFSTPQTLDSDRREEVRFSGPG